MRCPICDTFHREYDQACEEETTVTLQLRSDTMLQTRQESEGPRADQERWEAVLSSRMRQMKALTRLEEHKAQAHAA
jgi:hypothetical protein